MEFKEVIANDNQELTKALKITQAPTLVVISNGEITLVENVSNIRRYIETNAMVKA